MTQERREKLKRFANDISLMEAVKEVLTASFLRERAEKDVHYLAAKSLAVEYLEDAWRELARVREEEPQAKTTTHVGL